MVKGGFIGHRSSCLLSTNNVVVYNSVVLFFLEVEICIFLNYNVIFQIFVIFLLRHFSQIHFFRSLFKMYDAKIERSFYVKLGFHPFYKSKTINFGLKGYQLDCLPRTKVERKWLTYTDTMHTWRKLTD